MGIHGRDYMRERSVFDGETIEHGQGTSRIWFAWAFGAVITLLWFVFAGSWGGFDIPQGSTAKQIWRDLLFHPTSAAGADLAWKPFTSMWFCDPVGVGHLIVVLIFTWLFVPRAERAWGAGRVALLLVLGSVATALAAWGGAALTARQDWVVLGPTGGLFAVGGALAWRGASTYVSVLGRGPWPIRRVVVVAQVVALLALWSLFEERYLWPIFPMTLGHLAAACVGIAFAPGGERAPKPAIKRKPVTREQTEEAAPDDVRDRVDALLAKIGTDGIESLSEEERVFLERASKGYR